MIYPYILSISWFDESYTILYFERENTTPQVIILPQIFRKQRFWILDSKLLASGSRVKKLYFEITSFFCARERERANNL